MYELIKKNIILSIKKYKKKILFKKMYISVVLFVLCVVNFTCEYAYSLPTHLFKTTCGEYPEEKKSSVLFWQARRSDRAFISLRDRAELLKIVSFLLPFVLGEVELFYNLPEEVHIPV